MADPSPTTVHAKTDVSGGALILGLVLLVIFFWGEPDLRDAMIHRLMTDQVSHQADKASESSVDNPAVMEEDPAEEAAGSSS